MKMVKKDNTKQNLSFQKPKRMIKKKLNQKAFSL